MTVTYHPDAQDELIEAAQFYQGRVPGIGVEFLQAVDRAISAILNDPVTWPEIEGGIHRYLMNRFPYGLLYSMEDEELHILAVMRLKRHPDYWKYRITN